MKLLEKLARAAHARREARESRDAHDAFTAAMVESRRAVEVSRSRVALLLYERARLEEEAIAVREGIARVHGALLAATRAGNAAQARTAGARLSTAREMLSQVTSDESRAASELSRAESDLAEAHQRLEHLTRESRHARRILASHRLVQDSDAVEERWSTILAPDLMRARDRIQRLSSDLELERELRALG